MSLFNKIDANTTGPQNPAPSGCMENTEVKNTAEKVKQIGNYLLIASSVVFFAAVLLAHFPLGIELWALYTVYALGGSLAVAGISSLAFYSLQNFSDFRFSCVAETDEIPGSLKKKRSERPIQQLALLDKYQFQKINVDFAKTPRGLKNPANNCWANAFMQLVLNSKFLIKHLINARQSQTEQSQTEQSQTEQHEKIQMMKEELAVLKPQLQLIKTRLKEIDRQLKRIEQTEKNPSDILPPEETDEQIAQPCNAVELKQKLENERRDLQDKKTELESLIKENETTIFQKRILSACNQFAAAYVDPNKEPDSQLIRIAVHLLQNRITMGSQEDPAEAISLLAGADLLPRFKMQHQIKCEPASEAEHFDTDNPWEDRPADDFSLIGLTVAPGKSFEQLLQDFCSRDTSKDEPFKREGIEFKKTAETYRFQNPPEELFFSLNRYSYDGCENTETNDKELAKKRPDGVTMITRSTQTTEKRLKRPDSKGAQKINAEIPPALELTLKKNVHLSSDQEDRAYYLKSFICHTGSQTGYGHYIAYVKKGDNWYLCNDRGIEEVSREDVVKAAATGYLLHYSVR